MKRFFLLVVAFSFGFAGCRQPPEVRLEDDDVLEVTTVSAPDSNFALSPVDSIAVLPRDQLDFAGQMIVVSATFDAGQAVRSVSFARVVFENRVRSVLVNGRVMGYQGLDLGPVTVNGSLMLKTAHRLFNRQTRRDTVAGFEYVRDLTGSFQPLGTYAWRAIPDSIGPMSLSINAPEALVVYSPRGGSVIHRDQDLQLAWSGKGDLSVIVSLLEPLTKKSKPLLLIRPRGQRHRAVLSRKILRLLPPERLYVFTYTLTNRRENETVQRFPGRVLLQAASVYSSYVELR